MLEIYDENCHDYSKDLPSGVEIEKGHFIWGNNREILEYKKNL